jgi:hypothetical protein
MNFHCIDLIYKLDLNLIKFCLICSTDILSISNGFDQLIKRHTELIKTLL